MLYQTPYPLLFQFHPLPSSSSCSTIPQVPHLPSQQVDKTEMECVETALKTSLRKDMVPQTIVDDVTGLNGPNGTSSEDFFVDDLLDFSHVDEEQQNEEEEKQDYVCITLKQSNEISNLDNSFSLQQDYGSLPTSDLNVPSDDVADLEWLSHFVEDSDSFSDFSAAMPVVTLTTTEKNPVPEPKPEIKTPVLTFKTPVQTKARSKRTRTGVRVWPFGSNSLTDSSTSSTSSSTSSSPTSPLLIYTNIPQSFDSVPVRKPKQMTYFNGSVHGAVVLAPAPRRCSHCGVQKTPQWRTGPLGAKTLCNACGVRYKSGRLLPEYRPACSPTFSSELHSNHHRKVLEMRRKKEVIGGVEVEVEIETETGLSPSPVVPSF